MTDVRRRPGRPLHFILNRGDRRAKARLRNKRLREGRQGHRGPWLDTSAISRLRHKTIAPALAVGVPVGAGVAARRRAAARRHQSMNEENSDTRTSASAANDRPRGSAARDRERDSVDPPLVHFVHFGDRTEVYEEIARRRRDISARTLRTLRFKTWVPFTRGFFSPYSIPSLKTKCTKCTKGCLPYAVPRKSRTLRILSRSVRSVRALGGVNYA